MLQSAVKDANFLNAKLHWMKCSHGVAVFTVRCG